MRIEELQEKLFQMWMMFDEICKCNKITYFFDSGCLLGAVREQNFIPWDDDIDVAITREEYNRLKKVLGEKLDSKYRLIEPCDYSPYFFDFIPKLIDTSVPLREETAEDRAYHNYQNRMAIDFIILDSVPDSKIKQKLIVFKCKLIYGLARSKRYKTSSKSLSISEKVLSEFLVKLGRLFSVKNLLDMYEYNTMKYANDISNTFIRSNSLLYFIDCYRKECYESTVYKPFHGELVPIPVGYDVILKKLYGDYMTPSRHYKGFIHHADE